MPAFLFAEGQGIVPIEAVLAKIEVKSVLTSDELRDAIKGAIAFRNTPLVLPDNDMVAAAPLRCVFAFDSDLKEKNEITRLREMMQNEQWPGLEGQHWNDGTPPIQALCVVGRGMWAFASYNGRPISWQYCPADAVHSEVVTFLGTLLNTLPPLRETRRGARLGSHLIDMEKDLKPI